MPNNNASSVLFGWDFQINSAIVLMLDNIQVADDVRVEGDTEDIELYLNNGEKIFSQAKSIVRIDDYSNVIAKLKNSLRSLSNANHSDVAKLIYVTNTPNPFNNTETMSAFYGHTRISYSDLPTICKNKIDEIVDELNLDNFEQTKFHIHIIPFFTDNFDERHKVIKQSIQEFLFDIDHNLTGLTQRILRIWQNDFFHNGSVSDTQIRITKSELIWPIVVLSSQFKVEDDVIDDLDEAELEDVERRYNDFITNCIDRFELATKVLSEYQVFEPSNCTRNEKKQLFIQTKWNEFFDDFGTENEILIKVVINKILKQKFLINNIKHKVNL